MGQLAWLPLIVLLACNCGGSSRSPSVDSGQDAPAVSDQAVDIGVDVRRDTWAPGGCGGKRTLALTKVPRGQLTPCGEACRQVTWMKTPYFVFDTVGDILAFRNHPQGSADRDFNPYYVDLASGAEYRIGEDRPYTSNGCSVVATDGKTIAMSCVREGLERPAWKPRWLRSLTLFDPQTKVAEDLLCIERRRDDKTCFPTGVARTGSGIAIRIGLTACAEGSIYHMEKGAASLTDIANAKGDAGYMHAEGDRVVWTEYRPEWKTDQIVLYDLKTKTAKRIAPTQSPQSYPRIGGDKIVWVDHRNDPTSTSFDPRNTDIYVHDLKSGKTEPVIVHPAEQGWPDVSGKWVVWHDYRDSPKGWGGQEIDVFAKDLDSGKVYQITDFPGFEAHPRVDKGRLFYYRAIGVGHAAIFMVDLDAWVKAQAKGTP